MRTLAIVLFAAASIAFGYYRIPIVERTNLLVAQHRCLNYSAPASLIVYESGSGRVDPLGASEGTYCERELPSSFTFPGIFRRIEARERIRSLLPRDSAPPVLSFGAPAGPGNSATVFLHARRAKGGAERLVILDWDGVMHAQVIRPASPWRGPELLSQRSIDDGLDVFKIAMLFNDEKHLGTRIFAGQPDPNDESRFTIDCYVFGVNFRLLGQLLPNDTVDVQLPDARAIEQQVERVYLPPQ
jgi:hypothetical protein